MTWFPIFQPRKPTREKSGSVDSAPEKRWAANLDIKVNVAACIRNCGLVVVMIYLVMKPADPVPNNLTGRLVEALTIVAKLG